MFTEIGIYQTKFFWKNNWYSIWVANLLQDYDIPSLHHSPKYSVDQTIFENLKLPIYLTWTSLTLITFMFDIYEQLEQEQVL
jgi:hypothetical protein